MALSSAFPDYIATLAPDHPATTAVSEKYDRNRRSLRRMVRVRTPMARHLYGTFAKCSKLTLRGTEARSFCRIKSSQHVASSCCIVDSALPPA